MTDRPYLSIGEVLALLLEEFPDVTISKIRFLESQGLIDPERTPSGYRKFYEGDVERLRVILREQRENFLPLRVIRDRLERGQIDDTGPQTPPRGLRNVTVLERPELVDGDDTGDVEVPPGTEVPTAHHPAARHANPAAQFFAAAPAPSGNGAFAQSEVRDNYLGAEVCSICGLTEGQLAELESFGLVSGKGSGVNALYSASDLAIAKVAAAFLARGVDARHLRGWRQSAEREASLFEQLVLPLIRQRNPQSRQQAAVNLGELCDLGAQLRSAILAAALQHHLES